jgi:LDH2 family malate/lactate/ureidoglycolate dehydrogenase
VVPDSGYKVGNGMFLQAFDVEAFRPLAEFAADSVGLADAVRHSPPAAGFDEVLLPGDPERRSAQARAGQPLEVGQKTYDAIVAAAAEFGVPTP